MNYKFCDDLTAPEMCVIMNRIWWINNKSDILSWLGQPDTVVSQDVLFMPDVGTRTMFALKWPQ